MSCRIVLLSSYLADLELACQTLRNKVPTFGSGGLMIDAQNGHCLVPSVPGPVLVPGLCFLVLLSSGLQPFVTRPIIHSLLLLPLLQQIRHGPCSGASRPKFKVYSSRLVSRSLAHTRNTRINTHTHTHTRDTHKHPRGTVTHTHTHTRTRTHTHHTARTAHVA